MSIIMISKFSCIMCIPNKRDTWMPRKVVGEPWGISCKLCPAPSCDTVHKFSFLQKLQEQSFACISTSSSLLFWLSLFIKLKYYWLCLLYCVFELLLTRTWGFLILLIQIIFLLNSALTLPGFPADAITYFLISAFTDTGRLMYFQSSPACLNFPPGMTDEVISVGHRVEN